MTKTQNFFSFLFLEFFQKKKNLNIRLKNIFHLQKFGEKKKCCLWE